VGLRWWNEPNDQGQSAWRFEQAPEVSMIGQYSARGCQVVLVLQLGSSSPMLLTLFVAGLHAAWSSACC
jgi:hypothetical protein